MKVYVVYERYNTGEVQLEECEVRQTPKFYVLSKRLNSFGVSDRVPKDAVSLTAHAAVERFLQQRQKSYEGLAQSLRVARRAIAQASALQAIERRDPPAARAPGVRFHYADCALNHGGTLCDMKCVAALFVDLADHVVSSHGATGASVVDELRDAHADVVEYGTESDEGAAADSMVLALLEAAIDRLA